MTEIQQQKNIKIIFKIFSFFVQTFFDLDYHWPLLNEKQDSQKGKCNSRCGKICQEFRKSLKLLKIYVSFIRNQYYMESS